MNGLNLYYLDGLIDPAAIIIGGSPIQVFVPGDASGDGFVGSDDLVTVLTYWGQTGAVPEQGDLTGDGFVGVDDYVEVLTYWGSGSPPEPIPEPTMLGLLLVGSLLLVRLKQQGG